LNCLTRVKRPAHARRPAFEERIGIRRLTYLKSRSIRMRRRSRGVSGPSGRVSGMTGGTLRNCGILSGSSGGRLRRTFRDPGGKTHQMATQSRYELTHGRCLRALRRMIFLRASLVHHPLESDSQRLQAYAGSQAPRASPSRPRSCSRTSPASPAMARNRKAPHQREKRIVCAFSQEGMVSSSRADSLTPSSPSGPFRLTRRRI